MQGLWAARSPLWQSPRTLCPVAPRGGVAPVRFGRRSRAALRSALSLFHLVHQLCVGAIASPTRATAFRVLQQARALEPVAVRCRRAFARAAHNLSLNRTRYGSRRKPGLRQSYYRLSPGLRRLPPQAG